MTTVKKLLLMTILTCGMQCSLQALNPNQIQEIISFNKALLKQTNLQAHIVAQWLPNKVHSATAQDQLTLFNIIHSAQPLEDKITALITIKQSDESKTNFIRNIKDAIFSSAAIMWASGLFIYWRYLEDKRNSGWT